MLIYVKIIKKKTFYGRTTQNFSSEPHKNLNPLFQTGDVVYGGGKLRDLGMVFKASFKCLKNKKINFSPAILKLETSLYQNIYIYIISSYIIFAERF